MGRPITTTLSLSAADDDGVALSQSPGAAGFLTINGVLGSGALATAGTERQIIITSGGNDSGRTFTIVGKNADGNPVTYSMAGANIGVAASAVYMNSVTSVYIDGASAGTVQVGTNGVGASRPVNLDPSQNPMNASVQIAVTGTVNYTLQYTVDDLQGTPVWLDDGLVVAQTVAGVQAYAMPITGIRTKLNSGTGTVTTRTVQSGIGA